ncbi:protein-methionine-sulfoxide reductase heme-binding subunit MsrQ [Alteromonas oceanisediminis]|uniref:protein-methionine-sulfoxide reductase heme-binding subunit MsrQ n=1 Tax=Alteromonas oceanisediminis TaxID=2836180 RepID=UPI001BDB6938|nr:protein-methionine-sulfoxide reductase heme-binding subunit MsrQ [Alteromonas oceanisediminis]MBT0586424.1 protein-methionine-sulfoxide reductase heme-binding subunit MsrQ [Alteromonas oceanisediminis]
MQALSATPLRLSERRILILKWLLHGVSFSWVAYVFFTAVTDQVAGDPVDRLLHFTGMGALNLLLLSLAISPVAKRFRAANLIKLRRPTGLWAFSYALLHLATFVLFELQLEWALIGTEIIERPYITVGFSAFIILLLLAATSITAVRRRMGRRWQLLHNWVYVSAPLVVIHFYWSVKSDVVEPVVYGLLVLVLLYVRRERLRKIFRG